MRTNSIDYPKTLRSGFKFARALFLKTVLISMVLQASSHAQPIYRQTFGFNGADVDTFEVTPFRTVGWSVLWSGGSYLGDKIFNEDTAAYLAISNERGRTTDSGNINTSPTLSEEHGVVRLVNLDNFNFRALVYTDEFTLDRTSFNIDTISWYGAGTGGGNNVDSISAAIRIGGLWYVSDETVPKALLPNNSSSFQNSARLFTVDVATANWFTLGADLGTAFVRGDLAVALPDGDIEAFGLYSILRPSNGSFVMFDTFEIGASPIPEPASVAFLIIGVGIGICHLTTRRVS